MADQGLTVKRNEVSIDDEGRVVITNPEFKKSVEAALGTPDARRDIELNIWKCK